MGKASASTMAERRAAGGRRKGNLRSALCLSPGTNAEPAAVAGLEEHLTRPICLSFYNSAVSLSCGHSFCKERAQEALGCQQNRQGPFGCPLCRVQADPNVQLQPNVQLRSTAQKLFNAATHQQKENHGVQRAGKRESSGQADKVILCDFCFRSPSQL